MALDIIHWPVQQRKWKVISVTALGEAAAARLSSVAWEWE